MVVGPTTPGDRLDGLDGDTALGGDGEELLGVAAVPGFLHQHVAVGEQDRSEGEPFQRPQMHARDAQPVAGDADVPHEPFVLGSQQRFHCATRRVGDLPLILFDEIVELHEVDPVDTQPTERPFELGPRRIARAFAGLGGQEELTGVGRQPRRQTQLRIAVRRRGVDVVDAVAEQQRQHLVGLLLAHRAEGGGAEHDPTAEVTGGPESAAFDHGPTLLPVARTGTLPGARMPRHPSHTPTVSGWRRCASWWRPSRRSGSPTDRDGGRGSTPDRRR